jgi:hypothetical protein
VHQLQKWRKGFIGIGGLCCCLVMVLSAFGEASARTVVISSPAGNAAVSGSISIAVQVSSSVSWVNFYVDHVWIAASPPYSALWNSTSVSNGQHAISVNAYASNGRLLATSSTNVRVTNKSATLNPTPTPAPTSTPTPAATPISTGNAYYIDSNQTGYNGSSAPSPGSACALADKGAGSSKESPKCTIASVSAMQSSLTADSQVLFKRGDVWSEELTITNMKGTSGHPIVLSAYGSGASPVIDGGSARDTCVNALNTTAKYITIDGFECRNSTEYGMTFQTSGGQMPGITVENSYIHNTGPGAYAGRGGAFDDGNYRNQLDFEDFGAGTGADGVSFMNNTVNNCGGHNCLEVHYDAGGPIVHGNVVGPGCLHNCIDLKGAVGAKVDQNVATTGAKTGPQGCIYLENTYTANSTVLVTRNVCYGSAVAFQIDTGGSCVGHQHCLQTVTAYNNTMVTPADAAYPIIVGGSGAPADITVTWENNITDGGTVDVNPAVGWTGDYNDDGGHQGQYSTNVTPGSHDLVNVDPFYINFQGNNYQLQSDSPVSHAGLPGLDNDMTSLGAYPAP